MAQRHGAHDTADVSDAQPRQGVRSQCCCCFEAAVLRSANQQLRFRNGMPTCKCQALVRLQDPCHFAPFARLAALYEPHGKPVAVKCAALARKSKQSAHNRGRRHSATDGAAQLRAAGPLQLSSQDQIFPAAILPLPPLPPCSPIPPC